MATIKKKATSTAPKLKNTVLRTPKGESKAPKVSKLPYTGGASVSKLPYRTPKSTTTGNTGTVRRITTPKGQGNAPAKRNKKTY